MSHAVLKTPNLGSLGTIWALPRFSLYSPCAVTTYQSGHQNQGETYTQKNLGGQS